MGLTKGQVNKILDNFIDNIDYYSKDDFADLRNTISDFYYNDLKLLNRITDDKQKRSFFSSQRLIHKIISEINRARFTFQEDSISDELFEVVKILELHENEFFAKAINLVSIDFLLFVLTHLNDEIVKKNKASNYGNEIDILYSYFRRIISGVDLEEKDRSKYRTLYDKFKLNFQAGNYRYANIYFRFFFYYHDKEKLETSIKNDVKNITIAYLNYEPNATSLKEILESTCNIDFFFKPEGDYLSTIYAKCKKIEEYACTFYEYFENNKKQQLVESWVPVNRNKPVTSLKNIVEKIEYNIPNKGHLANKILRTTKVLNVVNERSELYNIFQSLGLNKPPYDFSEYSQQVIDLVCNSDINLQKLGLRELQRNKTVIDKAKLKEQAEIFLITLFKNIPAYLTHIKNIFDAKIGITKKFIDGIVHEHSAIKSQISNYFITTDDAEFYETLMPKLNSSTIREISSTLVTSIARSGTNHPKLIGILVSQPNFQNLEPDTQERLKELNSK